MTAIWQNDGSAWRLLAPAGFPSEAELHSLIEDAPHILPLAGSPQLVILGREVGLGPNFADLVAVEPSGRLAVIEVKLKGNPESRRAIIAQVLTYAAYLRGLDVTQFERDILARHLAHRGVATVAEAAQASGQDVAFDPRVFTAALGESLASGRFRLVLVLDEAPEELVRLVGYLEAVTDQLTIDLVTVASYRVGEAQIVVPQRIEPERQAQRVAVPTAASSTAEATTAKTSDFATSIESARPDLQPALRRLLAWAQKLEQDGVAQLAVTRDMRGWLVLRLLVPGYGAGLVTIWGGGTALPLQVWRSLFERRAPQSLSRLEALVGSDVIRQGNALTDVGDPVLDAIAGAYHEAAGRPIAIEAAEEE